MSKRSAADAPDGEPSAKRHCGEAAESGLIRLLEVSGLNDEFLTLLDPISERALRCVCRELRDAVALLSLGWPLEFHRISLSRLLSWGGLVLSGLSYDHLSWNRQLLLALRYDHLGRFLSIYLHTLPIYIQATREIVSLAFEFSAVACAVWFAGQLSATDFYAIEFDYATDAVFSALRQHAKTVANDIRVHLLLAEQIRRSKCGVRLSKMRNQLTLDYIVHFPLPSFDEPHHFDYIKMQLR
jgi:hypothetical protein